MGSDTRRLERCGTCAGTQSSQAGRLLDTGTGYLEPESSGRGEWDSDRVTQHQVGVDGGTGGGALRPEEM